MKPIKLCSCGKPVRARGLCIGCYNRAMRTTGEIQRESMVATGTCSCGIKVAVKGMCWACYHRSRLKQPNTHSQGENAVRPL